MPSYLPESDLRELLLWILRLRLRYRVTGASMFPLLKPGDEVLAAPRAYRHTPPMIGDIVVLWHPEKEQKIIKRIADVLADGGIVVHGDNPAESVDSRTFGAVRLTAVLGKVTSKFP